MHRFVRLVPMELIESIISNFPGAISSFRIKNGRSARLEFHLCPLKTLSQDNACCREIFGKDGYDGT